MTVSDLYFLMKQKNCTIAELSDLSKLPESTIEKYLKGELSIPDYLYKYFDTEMPERSASSMLVKEPLPAYGEKRKYTLDDYYALPEERKVELIDGTFYEMTAPTTVHQILIANLAFEFMDFIESHQGNCLLLCGPVDVQLDCNQYTMLEPDLLIVCDHNKVTNRCIVGAPDFVIEVLSSSTKKKDMTIKLVKYRKAGVREYWMIDPDREAVITYFFEKSDMPVIYGTKDKIPVQLYNGELVIHFNKIFKKISSIIK